MAITPDDAAPAGIARLRYISLTTAALAPLADFYERSFGCRRLRTTRHAGAQFERLMQVSGGAQGLLLELGQQRIELLQFEQRGRAYPAHASAADLVFQHFAIVVSDIQRALRVLERVAGWTTISIHGPQQLPPSSGGVSAFKFRDPEGHPLELLAFAPGSCRAPPSNERVCLGIDHSAISVADTRRSVEFYQALGFKVAARSLNSGIEQQRLDGVPDSHVEVTALVPPQATPHLELLCYRATATATAAPQSLHSNDIAATRLVLQSVLAARDARLAQPRRLIDPDGHQLLIT